jgi:hypothetical protein
MISEGSLMKKAAEAPQVEEPKAIELPDSSNEKEEFLPVKVEEKKPLSPEELEKLKSKESLNNENIRILIEQLETGSLQTFDQNSVELLQKVLADNNKKGILSSIKEAGLWSVSALGAKVAGVFAGWELAGAAKEYVSGKMKNYLSGIWNVDPSGMLTEVAKTDTGASGIFGAGKEALKAYIAQPMQELYNSTISGTANALNDKILHPMIEAVSKLTGFTVVLPAGALGYLGGSMLVGGTIEMYKERKKNKSFERIDELITKIKETKDKRDIDKDGFDPRLELIALHDEIVQMEGKNFKMSNEEWLIFVGAVRSVKVELLREKTLRPLIVVGDELDQELKRQQEIIEAIISGQQEIVNLDLETAAAILASFETKISNEVEPVAKYLKNSNNFFRKIGQYSKAFVRGGINATGLPTLGRLWKKISKIASTYSTGGLVHAI